MTSDSSRRERPIVVTFLAFAAIFLFWVAATQRGQSGMHVDGVGPQVVLPAMVQLILYGGDRFLAADVESVRAAASGRALDAKQGGYRIRAHRVVAQLNPCHEDNYWVGNAALSFGGAANLGNELLERAVRCRFWDDMPPFLLGFNQKFFNLNVDAAVASLEIAAKRSSKNATGYRQMAILMRANSLNDAQAAMAMLAHERDQAGDARLKELLGKRIERLQGLLELRDAKKKYEQQFGKPLQYPQALISTGILSAFPRDPLRLGYEFRENEFHLKGIRIAGVN